MMLGFHSNSSYTFFFFKENMFKSLATYLQELEGTSLNEYLASFLKYHISVHNRCYFGPLNISNLFSEFPLEKWTQEHCYSMPLNHLHHALGKEKAFVACVVAFLSRVCAGPHSGREQPVLTWEGPGSLVTRIMGAHPAPWSPPESSSTELQQDRFFYSLNCIKFLQSKTPSFRSLWSFTGQIAGSSAWLLRLAWSSPQPLSSLEAPIPPSQLTLHPYRIAEGTCASWCLTLHPLASVFLLSLHLSEDAVKDPLFQMGFLIPECLGTLGVLICLHGPWASLPLWAPFSIKRIKCYILWLLWYEDEYNLYPQRSIFLLTLKETETFLWARKGIVDPRHDTST